MIKYLIIEILILLNVANLLGQRLSITDATVEYFDEIKIAAAEGKNIWELDMYAPLLLVNPVNRSIFANISDSAGILKREGAIYTGFLPQNVNIANTSLRWSGEAWAMVMLPLPEEKADRICLLAHELFHRAQPSLGFKLANPDNNHLDQKEGRMYLRLELEALRAALMANSDLEMREHLTDAITFRRYRHTLYPGADSTENELELNEGIAEYTGVMISNRNKPQVVNHFVKSFDQFLANPSFVRSFAYQTIPLYGYMLHGTNPTWNRDISSQTNLGMYFQKAFHLQIPGDLNRPVEEKAALYGGQTIIAEETAREARIKKLLAEYEFKFLEQPHVDIPLQNMNISFDPRNIMPLGNKGTVYPNIRITDTWGILTVTNGALMSPHWDRITLSAPTSMNEENVLGDGWMLQLEPGFAVQRREVGSNYILRKK
jgi:hypothetical protein